MKQRRNNICKFITSRDSEALKVENFIYESVVAFSGETQCKDTNALYLVADGQGFFSMGGHRHALSTGIVFLSFAGIPFVIENAGGLSYYYVSFSGGRVDELLSRFDITPSNCIFTHQHGLLPLWQESILRADESDIGLLGESLLLHTFSRFQKKVKQDDVTARIKEYAEAHLNDHTLTLETLSRAVGYSSNYLSHLFKQKFGISFSEYLRLIRMKHAVMLIENGVTSVKNVAALCGYADPLYFSKLFRETVGVSPGHYCKKTEINEYYE